MNIISQASLKTDRQVGIVIPTALRHDFTPFLHKLENQMVQNGMKPLFFIQAAPLADAEKGISVIRSQFPQAEISIGPAPVGQRVQMGLSAASKKTDVMFFTCDDFDHLLGSAQGITSASLPGFAKQIGEKNDVLLGSWDCLSASYLPYPMWLNEAGISAAVTYARPNHPASFVPIPDVIALAPDTALLLDRLTGMGIIGGMGPDLLPDGKPFNRSWLNAFISKSKNFGTWVQVYIGVDGIVSGKWDGIHARMHHLFGHESTLPCLYGVGTEVGIPLAAFDMHLEVGSYKMRKRFEHSINVEKGSVSETQFAKSRQNQFLDGAAVILRYVVSTHQPEKAQFLYSYLNILSSAIASAPFHWPGHENWPRASDANSEIRTGF